MQDLIGDLTKELYRKVSENFDDLVFSLLGQFGINKDNWREYIGRVEIIQTGGFNKHFIIDGEYRFTIIEQPGELIIDDEKDECKYVVNYKVEVLEELLFGGK